MKNIRLSALLILGSMIPGCTKNNETTKGFHIVIKSGADQTGAVAGALKNYIVFSVTMNGQPLRNGYVRISTASCGNDPESTLLTIGPGYGEAGQVSYQWRLGGNTGKQILDAVLLDSTMLPKDSVQVNATAIAASPGWNTSGCIPVSTFANTFCRLSSGRIFTGLRRADYPYYSDDNGAGWTALKTFPNTYAITKMIAVPTGEMFIAVYGVGMFYSADGGVSWEPRNNGLTPSGFWGDIQFTASGKLFVLTGNGIFTSPDKGLNWHQVTNGLYYYAGFSEAASTTAGTVYAIHDNGLVVSADGGENWRPVYTISTNALVQTLFIDDNDDIYFGGFNGNPLIEGIYVSKDQAQTWQRVYTAQPAPGFDGSITALTKQQGSYYFYATSQNLLTNTKDFLTYNTVNPTIPTNGGRNSFRYIIAGNGEAIMSTEFFGIQYFLK